MDCKHEVQFNGLCAICGAILESSEITEAGINMSHDLKGLTVSRKEAERLEKETAERLRKDKKLSLILDLDQTIVHATWDPTVGEWMDDEKNANHSATEDIRKFTLAGSPLVYYIKLRPGLSEFLEKVSQLYELHIYTMGTRHYAEAVAREIDPRGTMFRERILSRDESGSVTQKTLQRLFPCDTSMVVVLDDRSDVWSFSPNLIKIKPYEFFVGTGDINSPFGPKQVSSTTPHFQTHPIVAKLKTEKTEEPKADPEVPKPDDPPTLAAQTREQEAMVEEQTQQRPLAQKQTELNARQERPLLVDDDRELYTMLKILSEVHSRYYKAADSQTSNTTAPDVKEIIPSMKSRILKGLHLVFSGVIPLHQEPSQSWLWQLAISFGANCELELTGKVTHLIAAKPGTSKVKAALKYGKRISIVTPAWLVDSTSRWAIQDEALYGLAQPSTPQEIENPESTPLDFEDAFEDADNSLVENIDWDEADREVEDCMNESGTDVIDTDSDTVESPLGPPFKGKRKRYASGDGEDEESDEDSDQPRIRIRRPSRSRSPLSARRAETAQRGRSHLSKVTTANSSDGSESPSNESDSSSSFLDDLAGELDDEID
ncbi:hypothetical protein J3Q64DRAFT_1704091 [Phycomyces blakesleeanus]|uniref:RNA polymerase II subunit A C-terminal domain phosphatase n=1 Tax=Phycomyces blakesleeanus TaxID=4837 RepID=A0ABR3AI84_PHYBL